MKKKMKKQSFSWFGYGIDDDMVGSIWKRK